jgi:hypothetical protein
MDESCGQFDGESAAYLKQVDSEEAARATPESARRVLSSIAGKAEPFFGKTGTAILGWLGDEAKFNALEFARCVVDEFARAGRKLDEVEDAQRALKIYIHGADEAIRSHDREKISRLAAIATTGILNPVASSQKIDEFIRVAGILIDSDILVLSVIFESQCGILTNYLKATNNFSRDETQEYIRNAISNMEASWTNEIYASWKYITFTSAGSVQSLDRSSVRSAIVRLSAVGLVADIPSSGVDGPLYGSPCALLELGYDFIQYLRLEIHSGAANA